MSGEIEDGARYRRAIGRTIAMLRSERGTSLRAMSESSGISLAYLSEIEHGLKEPSGAMLSQLASAFDLSLPELLRIVAEHLDSESTGPEISLEDLDSCEIEELASFADWLRWRKAQHGSRSIPK